ncbi:Capsular glucan synthase [Limihaloglobus sulfuriphilus]|uniref:Capsular glucan synthase n=1 Tax=Limihaloglobus sulfuriphilus TaxID=1851148 RepID=A0A1Q2MAQ0_9BACT|nr:glycosyltransferase family 4 protein [Limihaloglobus sulfuriphilus]AQQ69761.1 Capsular glucan synthase [Limihaloglobus sulfuriphilus]
MTGERIKIAQIVPGVARSTYCENCLRDAALFREFLRAGHEAYIVPLYLPFEPDGQRPAKDMPMFFGGINVYLQQKLGLFRKTPRWFDRFFDNPRILSWLARRSSMVNARFLGKTTVSMLKGQNGRQAKEALRLAQWLALPQNRPDVVVLSNALLAGLVGVLKDTLGCAVVCLLQDEDKFLDSLPMPYSEESWDILREILRGVDMFAAPSSYYKQVMQSRLDINADKIAVVPGGLDPQDYSPAQGKPQTPVIGFLSRMSRSMGVETLVDAFEHIRRRHGLSGIKLHIAGVKQKEDYEFMQAVGRRIQAAGLGGVVEIIENPEHESKLDFLRGLSVMCVPAAQPPAYGFYVIESLACGVPAVVPDIGGLPELIEQTGGGSVYDHTDPAALEKELISLFNDPKRLEECGRRGREAVLQEFNIEKTAAQMLSVFKAAIENSSGGENA